MKASKKRYIGADPVIGIRPIIDAREGKLNIRASLEQQTMRMAQSAARLITDRVRLSDGRPVKVVIASKTIGRVAEAAECAEDFSRQGVSITLSVSPCWCYGSETMDSDPLTIKAVWGLNATERPGAVYLASVLAAYARKGLPAFGIYGHDVQEADDGTIPPDVESKILTFIQSAVAVVQMRGRSYLQIGGQCMGISGSMIDPDFFEEYLGMRVESIDEVEVIRRIEKEIYDKDEYATAIEWTRKKCIEGFDKNPEEMRKTKAEKEKDWEFTVKCALIIKDLMRGNEKLCTPFSEERLGHNAIAAGFQGQRQWTDHYPNTDFPEAILNSSFDWEGIREPFILATENDSLNGVSMLFGKLLSGGRPQMFADVRTCWTTEAVRKLLGYNLDGRAKQSGGFIHLINSGACCLEASGASINEQGRGEIKPFWRMTDADVDACLSATRWCPADRGYFREGGFSSRFITKEEMPLTMSRVNIVKGLGPVMQLVEGYSIVLPDEIAEKVWKRTDYTWPCTWFVPNITGIDPFDSAYSVMNNWGANHGAICYGHIGDLIITMCSMLRIPVAMHNVPANRIFRPSCWNSFGMDRNVADYFACRNFGPLYC